ncbi:MAG: hypothetical protein Q8O88_04950 [bacterium]|nr:hypothetical protein [bacterium]
MKNNNYNYEECVGKVFGNLLVKSFKKSNHGAILTVLCIPCNSTFDIHAYRVLNGTNISCGCQRGVILAEWSKENRLDLAGKTFGKLTVLEVDEKRTSTGSSVYWFCRCECGKIKSIRAYHLAKGNTISCGHINRGKTSPKWTGYEDISGKFFYKIKRGAKQRQIDFNITIQEIWDLYLRQDKKCVLSGLLLNFPSIVGAPDGTASLDRIDSSKGYVYDNVQWVHKDINGLKMDLSEEELFNYCRLIIDYQKQKTQNFPGPDYQI